VTQQINSHKYDNGLTLLAEQMPWLESAAFCLVVPAGSVYDPEGLWGINNLACDMVQRGCGSRNSRQFVEDLERLGVDGSESVSSAHTTFSGATIASNLLPALSIYADLVREPHLPAEQLEDSRQVCFQELRAAEDDLAHKVLQRVRFREYPLPWGRPVHGEWDSVEAITMDDVQRQAKLCYRPNGTVISVAGNIDWPRLRDHVGQLFGSWAQGPVPSIAEQPPLRAVEHIPHEAQQTHIAISYPSVPYRNPDYFQARGVVGVLSDGMSSRLFTEVREKRGLCYTVYASCHTLRDRGAVICYSGTSADRAQETLDVILQELRRITLGVEQAELDRLKARIKSALIMQQESSSSRSLSIATDWYHLGRVMTLQELGGIVDALTAESLSAYIAANPPRDFTVVSLGAKPLEVNVGIS